MSNELKFLIKNIELAKLRIRDILYAEAGVRHYQEFKNSKKTYKIVDAVIEHNSKYIRAIRLSGLMNYDAETGDLVSFTISHFENDSVELL